MNAQIKLFLLGPFRAERAGQPLTDFKSNKVRALLAYLAVERDTPHHREVLASLLWPQSSNALALLRDVLSNLRHVLGDRDAKTPIIQVKGNTLQIDPSALWMDIAAFTTLAANATNEGTWERASALYRGNFLEGFTLANSPDFEAWALLRRETFQRVMIDTLYRLTTSYLQYGDYAAAQTTARRQLALDVYSEEAHRQLLRALALDGQRNQALAHYDDYQALLKKELNVAPDIRTTALYQRIRAGDLRPDGTPEALSPTGRPLTAADASDGHQFELAGRTTELARLETALQRAQRGAGQVIFVTGETGSGKTMLVQAFTRRLLARADDVVISGGTCNAQVGAGDPYLPFREILRLLSGDLNMPITNGALTPGYAQRLEKFAPAFVQSLAREGPDLIGGLVSLRPELAKWIEPQLLEQSDGELITSRRADQSPGRRLSTAALCDQVTRVLRTVARQCTLVLVLDDLHWADDSTLNLLAHLGRRLAGSRILLIGIYRPAEITLDHNLSSVVRELQRLHGDITLSLDRAGGRPFVDALLDSTPNTLDEAFRARLTRQTNGHALFTTALVQQMREEGALLQDTEGRWGIGAALDWSRMPPRVEAVIAERLSGLPAQQRELLTVASVEGEVFTAEVVAQVLGWTTAATVRELHSLGDQTFSGPQLNLVHALGLKRRDGQRATDRAPIARYRFRHALFQQYLYTQLGPVRRARFHEAIGHTLESLHEEKAGAIAAQLAYHFETAGLTERAVDYLLQAGRRAYQLSAPTESAALYRRGLALLEKLPPTEERDRREFELLLNQEVPLTATRGWGAPERAETLQRAYRLGQQLGETTRLLPVLQALTSVHIARAEHHAAMACAEQLSHLAEQTSHRFYKATGRRMMGTAFFFLGQYEKARIHLEAGLEGYTELSPATAGTEYVWDIAEEELRLRVWLPHVLLGLGYPEQAIAFSREALARSQELGYAGVQAIALTTVGGAFYATSHQPQETFRYAEQLLALATQNDLPAYHAWGVFYRGWAIAYQGQITAGISEMQAGLKQLKATGTRGSFLQLFTLLAEIYAQCGKVQQGEAALSRALTQAEQTDSGAYLAETYRVQGMLQLKGQDSEGAEASFRRAIRIARKQAAKLWELRATVSLARLWAAQGRSAEAYAQLSDIYDWFTEGFGVPDMVTARALLEGFQEN